MKQAHTPTRYNLGLPPQRNALEHAEDGFLVMYTDYESLRTQRDALVELVNKFTHDGRLQTFEDRELFRKEVLALRSAGDV